MKKILLTLSVVLLMAAACNNKPIVQQSTDTESQPQQKNQTASSTQTPPPVDEKANWKTYVSTAYGYSIKYPQNWAVDTQRSSSDETVFNNGMVESHISIDVRPYSKSLADWKNSLDQSVIISVINATVAGQPALRVKTGEMGGDFVGMVYNGKLYRFDSVSDDMLSTFKFTETTSVYSNTKYGYQIELPKTWKAYSEYDGKVIAESPSKFPNNPVILTGSLPDINFQIEFQAGVTLANAEKLLPQERTASTIINLKNNQKGKKYISGTDTFFLTETSQGTLKVYSNKNFSDLDKILSSIVIK